MADFRLVVTLEAQSTFRGLTDAEEEQFANNYHPSLGRYSYYVQDNSHLAGTYVEIENTGTVLSVDAGLRELVWTENYEPFPSWPTTARVEIEIPGTGQPIVLLAVPGGDQEFDRWNDGPGMVCLGQGQRCEISEPPAEQTWSVYAKAVFKKKASADDIRMGTFDGSEAARPKTWAIDPPRER